MSLAMALSVIFLNKWLINLIGINGAAVATLIVVFVYSLTKIIYIKSKIGIQPFGLNTLKVLLIIGAIYTLFYFWNFELHPVLNIIVKSSIIVVAYLIFIKQFNISEDLSVLVAKFVRKK